MYPQVAYAVFNIHSLLTLYKTIFHMVIHTLINSF
jgi:hypothetical protein